MTESDARAVLLMRAFEHTPGIAWTDGDDRWVSRESHHRVGEQADPERWLVERARLGLARLAQNDAALQPLVALGDGNSGQGLRRAGVVGLLTLAGLLGLGSDALADSHFVNLLAPPLLALLVWNVGVYLLLLIRALSRWVRAVRPGGRRAAVGLATGPFRSGLLVLVASARHWRMSRWARRSLASGGGRVRPAGQAAALAWTRFTADWWRTSASLQAARLGGLLHAMAALLALGALASLYGRGLVMDYRAGWDSTFLDAPAVHRLLGWLLGPAAALSGLSLPDAQTLAGLRRAGGGGESAARWIHLWALTLAGAVVLPRGLLAIWALVRARTLATHLAWGPQHDDLRRLLRSASGRPQPVDVLPYSYTLDAGRQAALLPWLDRHLGPAVQATVHDSLPLGAEDDPTRWWSGPPPATVVALFALTATPESETHGQFLRRLADRLAGPGRLWVMVDESGFRQGLSGRDSADRLAQRRDAWSALARELGLQPWFIDLSTAATAAGPAHDTAHDTAPTARP